MSRSPAEFRLFLSSTFKDLQAEREVLVKRVFPEIRALCRSRGVEFTEIDLRWGLTDEDARQGRILRVCLEEIDRCRPFFLGLTGSRYGWIPTGQDIGLDSKLLDEYPVLGDYLEQELSITEIEFRYGVLEAADSGSALFYVKEAEANSDARLGELVNRLHAGDHSPRAFSSLVQFEHLARKDLQELVDRYWPPLPTASEESSEHLAFARSRRQAYVANPKILSTLDSLVDDHSVVAVTGPSGMGKSALLANWVEAVRRAQPDRFIFEHYVGTSNSKADHTSLVRRFVYEHDGQVLDEFESRFRSILERSERPITLVIDAVNQLEAPSDALGWLPKFLSRNVKVVLSCTTDHWLKELDDRGYVHLELLPLSEERTAIIHNYLATYQKRLSEDLFTRLLNDPKCSVPLFLRVVLEELRVFGSHENLPHHLATLLAVDDLEALFRQVLERLESDFGIELTRSVLCALWANPNGLSEHELLEYAQRTGMALSRAELSTFLISLEYHLLRNHGSLQFFHDYLARAVELKYLAKIESRVFLFRSLIEYHRKNSDFDRLTVAELYYRAEDFDQLAVYLADPKVFQLLYAGRSKHRLHHYWSTIEARIPTLDVGNLILTQLAQPSTFDRTNKADVFISAISFFIGAAKFAVAKRLMQSLHELIGTSGLQLAKYRWQLDALEGQLHLLLGEYASAGPPLERAMSKADEGLEASRRLHLHGLYLSYLLETGNYREADPITQRLVEESTSFYGSDNPNTIHALARRADIVTELGKVIEAESLLRLVLDLEGRTHGRDSIEAATAMHELGTFLRRFTHNADESIRLLAHGVEIYSRVFGEQHPDVATAMSSLAGAYRMKHDFESARNWYERALAIEDLTMPPMHPKRGTSFNNYGVFLDEIGEYQEAEAYFKRALNIRQASLGLDHPVTSVVWQNLGVCLKLQERYDEAATCLETCLQIRRKAFDLEHPETAMTISSLGILQKERHQLDAATINLAEALRIRTKILGEENALTARSMFEYGDVLLLRGNPLEAVPYLLKSYEIRAKLLGAEDAQTRRSLERLNFARTVSASEQEHLP